MLALLCSHRKQCPSVDSPSGFPGVEILAVHFFSLLTGDFPVSDAGCLWPMGTPRFSVQSTRWIVCEVLLLCIIIILHCLVYTTCPAGRCPPVPQAFILCSDRAQCPQSGEGLRCHGSYFTSCSYILKSTFQ